MSFGPLLNASIEEGKPDNKKLAKDKKAPKKVYSKGNEKPKTEEEGNMSLVSYQGTEDEEDKYYSEEELTNSMGLRELNGNKKEENAKIGKQER